jgi:prophage antirepressor-like protein
LDEEYHRLVATSFAEYIKGDSDARTIDIDDVLHFFGYKNKQKAVELLQKIFPNTKPETVDIQYDNVFIRSGKNRIGRKKNTYLISFDQFEELLLAAQTPEGTTARKAVLAVKKAVFKYVKLEGVRAQQELEESMSQLAIKDEEHTAKLALAEREKAALAI